jgi:cellulose synthase (UDP-forming)
MTVLTALWSNLESGDSILFRALRWALFICGIFLLAQFVTLNLNWDRQAILGLVMVLLSIWLDRSSNSYLVTLTLMFMSLMATARYAWWRYNMVIDFFTDPANHWGWIDAFFMLILLAAESYAFLILLLGYLQTLWPLRRAPMPLPDDPALWPEVDLIIPSYNEPLSVVRYTALASSSIDYPPDKLHVYLLDDGHREDFRKFAAEAGIGYITRSDNKHAKAGNINHALRMLKSPYVAIFDSDHVPTRSFLQVTMGWFLRDRDLGMLQTPHHFYSPDPFERNLEQFRTIPNEGELFYGIVQDGNDFWNATFFCGSCAVLRRSALDEIGGIATETVTEDAHTSLRMQMHGWNTAYINIPQAAGLATERLSGHIKQRIRWARGMVQVLRVDNPLFAPGLSWPQRLCYFNAMLHFLYALPRLIFLTAPLIYMLLNHINIPGFWAAILAYALPHLVLSNVTNSRIQGQHRHSFWNEIYETVLAPYIMLPTMLAMISPKLGAFNVTEKGGVVDESYYDSRIASPFLVLLLLNMIGALAAIPRYFLMPYPLSLMNDRTHPGTIFMNLFWILFNIVMLGVATAVAYEAQQRRSSVRISTTVPAIVRFPDGTEIAGESVDLSAGGAAIQLFESVPASRGTAVKLLFPLRTADATLPATIAGIDGRTVRLQYEALTLPEQEMLTMVLFSRADSWLGWGESREADQPLRSLWHIMQLSMRGLSHTFRGLFPGRRRDRTSFGTAGITSAFLLALLLTGTAWSQISPLQTPPVGTQPAQAAPVPTQARPSPASPVQSTAAPASPSQAYAVQARPVAARPHTVRLAAQAIKPVATQPVSSAGMVAATAPTAAVSAGPGTFHGTFTLADIGLPQTIKLTGVDSSHSIYFALPQTQVVEQTSLRLNYHFSPALIAQLSHLKVSINGTLFATVPVQPANGQVILSLPAEMLARNNVLTFEFIGHYTLTCEDPGNTALWALVDASSTLDLSGKLLPLQDDLKLLPLPFFDSAVQTPPVLPFVFLSEPSMQALQAAGVVASWFGIQANSRPIKFPVMIGSIPSGNAVVISESTSQLPASMNEAGTGGPTITIRTNPNDPYGKILIVSGDDAEQLLLAAQALAAQQSVLQGGSIHISSFKLPAARLPDDAPRWLPTDRIVPFWNYTTQDTLQGDGTVPIPVYVRVPPDLYFGDRADISLKLRYAYNSIPLANQSSLKLLSNGAFIGNLPLIPGTNVKEQAEQEIAVPVVDLRPFSQSFLFDFFFQIAKQGNCKDTTPTNLYGAILRDSYLDIQNLPHWATMPNLELFSNAGFPFTRLADLADTKVVVPASPSSEELSLFLDLMGHFGAQTGYPALRVAVVGPDGLLSHDDRDYLVLGTVQDQPAIGKLNGSMPVTVDVSGIRVKDTEGFFTSFPNAWWKIRPDRKEDGTLQAIGGSPDSIIQGIENPWAPGRSIVVIALRDQATATQFGDAFLRWSQSSDISNSVSVLRGNNFSSYPLGNDIYHVGSISWLVAMRLWFMQYPLVVVLLIVVISLLMASWARLWLRRRARARLQAQELD